MFDCAALARAFRPRWLCMIRGRVRGFIIAATASTGLRMFTLSPSKLATGVPSKRKLVLVISRAAMWEEGVDSSILGTAAFFGVRS